MSKKFILLVLLLHILIFPGFAQNIKSPSEFLGYNLGEQFTPYYRVLDYVSYLTGISHNIKIKDYGKTYEGRPLKLVFIASDENINRLEEVRHNNLKLAGIESGTPSLKAPAIVWLSYNVHGNEPSSTEVSMKLAYELLKSSNTNIKAWLKNLIIIIDPCLNPDGRERYVNFYNSVLNLHPDPKPEAREHFEPWPGGRSNHYYFDLNRDWAWQTQIETQQRLSVYNKWLPQVHVDFHENGADRSYYFPPAAEPYHQDITSWQKEFQVLIGNSHAKYFDEKGWSYFTKEEYDLVYPSYGDTYPIYSGAIGMTYEQSGINAGLSRINADGDTLTLKDRIEHHFISSLSTIEVSSKYSSKLINEFKRYFDVGKTRPPGIYKAYIIKGDNRNKLKILATLLKNNGIQFGYGLPDQKHEQLKGYNYFSKNTESFTVNRNDMVISSMQPKSVLLKVLLEPETFFSDSITYDITAWALPYAHGLQCFAVKDNVNFGFPTPVELVKPREEPTNPLVYIAHWNSSNDVKFLGALLKRDIKVHYSEKEFTLAGNIFKPGSLIISRAKNKNTSFNFDQFLREEANSADVELTSVNTKLVSSGIDFGSDRVHLIQKPKIAIFSGDNINAYALGEIMHFFDQTINYPISLVNAKDFENRADFKFNVVILPDGAYDESIIDQILSFIKKGGKVIAMGEAVNDLSEKKDFGLKSKEKNKSDDEELKSEVDIYGKRESSIFKDYIPGAIYKVYLDNSHPLGFGFPPYYYTLKTDSRIFKLSNDAWNVGVLKKDSFTAGLAGSKAKAELLNGLLFGVKNIGGGCVVYLSDDPLFRGFWENGKLLFGNALFLVE
ncbi:MAG: zinc carboxypeptidase [Sphingobacteriales bacterium]|nr:zinc carboxypeptidase [Sphingobacteriales bacterium]